MFRWAQVDPQVGEPFIVVGVSLLLEDAEQILLARLAESEAIQSALSLETRPRKDWK